MTANSFDHDDGPAEEARYWIVRMASGAMEPSEVAGFQAWRAADPAHDAAFVHERAFWRTLEAAQPQAIPLPPRRRPARLAASAMAMAACVALAVFAPRIALWARADYQTGPAIRDLTLTDGTEVLLDAESAIAVHYTATERRIELLRGEAWFNVKHETGRPFQIAALGGTTEDIGTAFEVRRGAGEVEVGVSAGLVQVAAPEGSPQPVPVHQGERITYGPGGPVIAGTPVAADAIAPWRRGEMVLDNAPIAEAVRQIARYRGGPVFVLGDVSAARPVSAVFRTDRPDEALDAVAALAKLRVTHWPGGVVMVRPAKG
jgi:transmembrane sensor